MHNLKKPNSFACNLKQIQSSQKDITDIYTVEILRNTKNPSITEPLFVHTIENTSWMERKRIIPIEKCLKGKVG
jgi:hypothetical protein